MKLDEESERIEDAFVRFYGRPPLDRERAAALSFISSYQHQLESDSVPKSRWQRELWSAFCQALFASAEFQYRK